MTIDQQQLSEEVFMERTKERTNESNYIVQDLKLCLLTEK